MVRAAPARFLPLRICTVAIVALVFLAPSICEAAISTPTWKVYLDPETGDTHPNANVLLGDGGSYAVPFNLPGTVEIKLPRPEYSFYLGSGELYYIEDLQDPVREPLGDVQEFSWDREGTYELDIYITVLAPNRGPVERFFAWLLPTAHAQFQPEFLETIRFTITEGPPPAPPCCSSVLFIPGIQGSELAEGDDRLWPPSIGSNDLERLAINDDGESVNDVYVEDVLSRFYTAPIYEGFTEFLDEITNEDVISGWEGLAYDWRFPPQTIIEDGIKGYGDDLSFPLDSVYDLAFESKTGKVTIVAHSMGGLMGKAIIEALNQNGDAGLIDNFIMVGTPQLGTPLSAAALLHGDQQGIAMGAIVTDETARAVAQNMESAYNLLPSREYFNEVTDPIINFDPNASYTADWRARWGNTINTYDEFAEFLTGTGVARVKPDIEEMSKPEVLKSELVENADSFHSTFDTYEYPSNIRVVQVAGWGRPTVKNIEYTKKHIIFDGYKTTTTVEGDKTVVYPSAISTNIGERYYFNLAQYNKVNSEDTEHRDLLSAEPVEQLITTVLQNANVDNLEYISTTKPPLSEVGTQLLVTTRSPVLLGVYDSQGRFTGIDPDQNSSDILLISEEIPGSTFLASAEDQYVFVPKEGSYTYKLTGSGNGPATIEINTVEGDTSTQVITFTDIPVTTDTTAEFIVDSQTPADSVVEVDSDGDGQIDTTVAPDNSSTPPTLSELIANLKNKVQSLDIKEHLKAKLIKKIERIEKKIAKQKNIKASKILLNIEKKIIKKGNKGKINESDVNEILDLLDQIEKAL
jgi:pimeloyl-ACP methyl ester carboxylesterase